MIDVSGQRPPLTEYPNGFLFPYAEALIGIDHAFPHMPWPLRKCSGACEMQTLQGLLMGASNGHRF